MSLKYGFTRSECSEFSQELTDKGYAILSRVKNLQPGYYPNKFPDFKPLSISQIRTSDLLEIRAFIQASPGEISRVDSGLLTVKVDHIEGDYIFAKIETLIPSHFSLKKGDILRLSINEILRKH
jgi:hypothetical protein